MTLKKRIKKFKNALEKIEHTELPSDKTLLNNFYPFSNERGINSLITLLKTKQPDTFEKNTIRVAVLIGQSSFCSILATLSSHCDLVVFNDINPYLQQHTKKLLWLLRNSSTREEFEIQYAEYKQKYVPHFTPCQVRPDLQMRKETLKENHFLFSDETFAAAREASFKLQFAFSYANLFHADNRKEFFQCFTRRKCAITFVNLTNLYEWDAKKSLALIEKKEEWQPKGELNFITHYMQKYTPIIMFSTRENAIESCPLVIKACFSFQHYFSFNQQAAQQFIDLKFPANSLAVQTKVSSPKKEEVLTDFQEEFKKPESPSTKGRAFLPYQAHFNLQQKGPVAQNQATRGKATLRMITRV
ncbi:hypothetical protein [Candidatus Berkiella aquae]|uniref:Uncharacterized protein n=1 Tax=Candidatus Berkiella aquae TaxID=295108 RepID=A0A0Q9YP14_9GAMM|nr:hypothetical protein [Candidatus Berkiella aquae]MCS5712085.1 hypothetical protein [Candidatus Berkiella aquae]